MFSLGDKQCFQNVYNKFTFNSSAHIWKKSYLVNANFIPSFLFEAKCDSNSYIMSCNINRKEIISIFSQSCTTVLEYQIRQNYIDFALPLLKTVEKVNRNLLISPGCRTFYSVKDVLYKVATLHSICLYRKSSFLLLSIFQYAKQIIDCFLFKFIKELYFFHYLH